jgi:hypothetical protein
VVPLLKIGHCGVGDAFLGQHRLVIKPKVNFHTASFSPVEGLEVWVRCGEVSHHRSHIHDRWWTARFSVAAAI